MKRIMSSVLLALGMLAGSITSLHATTISFAVSSLGGNTYEYTYTVINDTLASDIGEFTIFFDFGLYESLAVTTPAAGWDGITVNPDSIFGVPDAGFYDAKALIAGIAPGATVDNFSVRFNWLGSATPGAQFFEVIEPSTLAVLDTGTTSPAVVSIPEPRILLLLSTGLLTLVFFRVVARKKKQRVGYVSRGMLPHWRKKSLSFSSLSFLLLFFLCSPLPSLVSAQSSSLTIGNYTLVNKVRVGRTTYDYIFRANITNNGSRDALSVSAALTSLVPAMTVVDGGLVFGIIPAGTTVASTDTFTVRIDRQSPFNSADVSWTINGTNVVGPGGGTVSSPSGARLILPPSSLAGTTTVDLKDQTLADLSISLPPGYSFLGAVSVDFGNAQLTKEADLEVPSAGPPAGRSIVAQVLTLGQTKMLTLVDTAEFDSGFMRTNSPPFPGIRTSGEYVFLEMPANLGIVGTYVRSLSGEPIEGASVSILVKSPGVQATTEAIDQSLASLGDFVGQSDATGFAAVPGVIPHSDVAAVAFSLSNPGLAQSGTVQFSVGDILTNGLLGNWIQNLIVDQLVDTSTLPCGPPPPCPCQSLTVVPHAMGETPPLLFLTGDSQDIKTVYCGPEDVTTSTDLAALGSGLLIAGATAHITCYSSENPNIASITPDPVCTGPPPVVTAQAPGDAGILIWTIIQRFFKICTPHGDLFPIQSCRAPGAVSPVRVSPTLAVDVSGSGSGSVDLNRSGTVCGVGCSAYPLGTTVQITAMPDSGSTFAGWSGDCSGTSPSIQVTMSEDKRCTATFSATVSLMIQRVGTEAKDGLVISVLDSRIDCGTRCQGDFNYGETVILGAGVLPGSNATFVKWGGDCAPCGTTNACPFQIQANMACTAKFESDIQVIEASYGNHCGHATGNVTRIVAQQCNGQTTCSVFVDNSVFGDPFFGCPKDFDVVWACGGGQKTARHDPVVNEGYTVVLTCP